VQFVVNKRIFVYQLQGMCKTLNFSFVWWGTV